MDIADAKERNDDSYVTVDFFLPFSFVEILEAFISPSKFQCEFQLPNKPSGVV